ncbi:hypothetical protein chiPu_0021894, partial [Chiloscyllium punctatum]|nr:hypothetical protein [Chiloscyllium punctatum]
GDDEPDLPRITCYSKLTNQAANDRIICELIEPITESETLNITFSEDNMLERCQIRLTETRSCSVEASRFTLFSPCCIRVSRSGSLEHDLCVLNKQIVHMVSVSCGECEVAVLCSPFSEAGVSDPVMVCRGACVVVYVRHSVCVVVRVCHGVCVSQYWCVTVHMRHGACVLW